MKSKIILIIGAILVLLLGYLVIRIISGIFSFASGSLNAILGIIVLLALLLIIGWMFYYAKHH